MNQRKNSGAAVLLYNLDGSERARKIKFILVRMGVRIKNIKKRRLSETDRGTGRSSRHRTGRQLL